MYTCIILNSFELSLSLIIYESLFNNVTTEITLKLLFIDIRWVNNKGHSYVSYL